MDHENGMSQEQNTQPVPGTDEYNQMMADRYRNGTSQGQQEEIPPKQPVPEMPEGGFEKFYNKETGEYDWQNHAKELQYRLDQASGKSSDKEDKDEGKEEVSDTDAEDTTEGDIYAKANLDPTELEQQIIQNGQLDADAKEALTKVGVPEALIDMFVTNYRLGMEAERQAILREAGGEESWNQISAFVETLPQEEQEAFYEGLGSKYRTYVLRDIQERMKTAGPISGEKPMLTGDTPASGTVGYRSKAEMKRDMADPRYQQDPAFRQQVMAKMAAASWDLDR